MLLNPAARESRRPILPPAHPQLDARELQRLLGEVDVLPPWARYPDAQRVSWLATIAAQLWPFAARFATQWIEARCRCAAPDTRLHALLRGLA